MRTFPEEWGTPLELVKWVCAWFWAAWKWWRLLWEGWYKRFADPRPQWAAKSDRMTELRGICWCAFMEWWSWVLLYWSTGGIHTFAVWTFWRSPVVEEEAEDRRRRIWWPVSERRFREDEDWDDAEFLRDSLMSIERSQSSTPWC